MPNKLYKFLLGLAENPRARASYVKDPYSVMSKAGLSSEQMATLLSKDPSLIRKAMAGSASAEGNDTHIVVVVVL